MSGLSRLMTDETECGGVVRNRILREEVATGGRQRGGDDCPAQNPNHEWFFQNGQKV